MTDSPAFRTPLDPKEQPILDHLLKIRDELLLLKQDKSTYIKSPDVISLYDEVVEQVHQLNILRAEKRLEQNRVDTVLDDCFQLISLLFMTVGRNNEAPAVYATTSTVKRLLDHLGEAGYFSEKDLESLGVTIDKMRVIVDRGKESYSPDLLTLLNARLDKCDALLALRREKLKDLSPEIAPIYEKTISILRSIAAANTKCKFPASEVKNLQKQLFEIRDSMVDGKFLAPDGSEPSGQETVKYLLERVLYWSDLVLERQGKVDENFSEIYQKLCDIRNHLEKLSLTQAWALRETDLYSYQRQLDRIDETRVNGNFVNARGEEAELFVQRTLLYLIRRSYAYIYALIISSEPVSEALLPIYNQLQTLKRCLLEVKRSGGISSPRELYPYSMKLNSIDNMRVDGKFMVGSDVPEGQASVNALLADCFDLSYELRVEADTNHDET